MAGLHRPFELAEARAWHAASATFCLTLLAVGCALAVLSDAVHPLQLGSPTLRATIETCTVGAALAGAQALLVHLRRTGELRDLLLLTGVAALGIAELISYAGPAAFGLGYPRALAAAPSIAAVFAAACLALAARVPRERTLIRRHEPELIALGTASGVAVISELGSLLLHDLLVPNGAGVGLHQALTKPLGLAVLAAGVVLMAVAAARFLRQAGGDETGVTACFAGAAMLFCADLLEYLFAPSHAAGQVSSAGIRLAAFALIAFGGLRQASIRRRHETLAIKERERQRFARDLHDGLCQDLAFIAAHGALIGGSESEEHPVAVAARRALEASRGALAELSASNATDTRQALRSVADELALRYGISIDVRAAAVQIPQAERDDLVRIAREAIVNAARHGSARNVTVQLDDENGPVVLRVTDDGCGISPQRERREGFGMTSMRERARELGAEFEARALNEGGTELEVVLR